MVQAFSRPLPSRKTGTIGTVVSCFVLAIPGVLRSFSPSPAVRPTAVGDANPLLFPVNSAPFAAIPSPCQPNTSRSPNPAPATTLRPGAAWKAMIPDPSKKWCYISRGQRSETRCSRPASGRRPAETTGFNPEVRQKDQRSARARYHGIRPLRRPSVRSPDSTFLPRKELSPPNEDAEQKTNPSIRRQSLKSTRRDGVLHAIPSR